VTTEIATTHAWRVPRGAQLVGGPQDGLTVIAAVARLFDTRPSEVVFLLGDGSQWTVGSDHLISFLHPERTRT
jgi:hypothetical protein